MLNLSTLKLGDITWLLAAMAFVIAPHTLRLPVWMTACCLAAGGWRWWIARRGLHSPPTLLMVAFTAGITAGAFMEYRRLFGKEVGVALLIVMLALKVLEMKQKRDAIVAIFLGFFLALTNFMYSQTIFMGAYMMICVWLFVATLIGFNRIGTEATVRQRLVPAGWLLVQSIPMMLVVFFLFPRLTGPLWSMPADDQALSGLTDNMRPGDFSKLTLSDAVAFRVDFEGAVPQSEDLYWRGPVLGQQIGASWRMYNVGETRKLEFEPQGPATQYRVTLQPHNKFWLFALDLPGTLPDNAFFTNDYQMRSRTAVTGLRYYEVSSYLRYRVGVKLSASERAQALKYSNYINPRSIAFAQKMRQENPDPKVFIEKLLKMYNSNFEYTLEPPPLGANPIDEFFFDTRKGFCEHYASSFVFLLRAADIPARVVTGYQGGEVNPISRQLVVRQSDAHAWAEVWFEDLGWVRADPTFAVSPLRINRGMQAAVGPQGVFNNLMAADSMGILHQIAYSWDALNNQWNQWVVGFNSDRQKSLLEDLFGMRDVDWRTIAVWLIGGVMVVGWSAGLLLMVRAYRTRKEPLVMAWDRLCRKLAAAGWVRAPDEGPMDFLIRIEQSDARLAAQVRPLVEAYVRRRYDVGAGDTAHVREFVWMVWKFRPAFAVLKGK